MKKILIVIISGILLVVFLLGFVDVVQYEPIVNNEVFTYSINSMPRDLKKVGVLSDREQDIICATSRGLIEFDSEGNILPSLAESVDVRDNGLEYDFKIRDNVYWSNGEKITPKDIAVFLREILIEEDENSIGALLNVYGAKEYKNGVGSFNKNVGISTNEERIKFRLNSSNENFLKELSEPQYRLRNNVLLWENIEENYTALIYSGNYSISTININEIELKRNKNINLELVETMKIIQNEESELAMAAFEIGNRDIVIDPPKSQLKRLSEDGKLISVESSRGMYMAFNPNSDVISTSGKRELYSLFNEALTEYQLENNILLELAEGSYFRENKDDLTKLQARKVMSNKLEDWEGMEGIVVIAEESSQKKELCEYLSKWFKENTDMYLNYKLMSLEEMENLHKETYYNIALLDSGSGLEGRYLFYDTVVKFIPKEYSELFKDAKSKEEVNTIFLGIEDSLFSTYQVLPLLFYNDNIAINNKSINVSLDVNENIDFNKLGK